MTRRTAQQIAAHLAATRDCWATVERRAFGHCITLEDREGHVQRIRSMRQLRRVTT